MASIKITFVAKTETEARPVAEIFRRFVPDNAAADLSVFDGTYYDTNVGGTGAEPLSLEAFLANNIAHPGLILALKLAMENGSYEFETEDAKDIMYYEEVAKALVDQGFTITVSKN